MTTEVVRIQGRRRRLRHCDDDPEELETTTEASAEEDDPKESMTTTEALAEEAEEMKRLSERLQWQMWRCVCGPRDGQR